MPEALPRAVREIGSRLGAGRLDRIWLFPPLKRGRRERGLVAASTFDAAGGGRRLFSAPYAAERSGGALYFGVSVKEEGEAPAERLPRIMRGVVHRSGDDLGDPREVEVGGDPARFEELVGEFDAGLFEEEAQPMRTADT